MSSPPNDQDKLPGRLERRCASKNRNAGPVNFIVWFGSVILNVPVFFVFQLASSYLSVTMYTSRGQE